MKKEKLIALLTAICMTTTPVFAETGLKIASEKKDADAIALKDLGISVTADHYTTVREDDDGFVYFYTIEDDSIPYVIVGQYDYTSDDFADDFTKYMNDQYEDLKETSKDSITINGLDFDRVTYEYTVSGYDAKDTRLFHAMDDSTYMFGIKEVPELDYTVDYDYLEDIAGSMKPLEDDEYKNYVDSEHDITEEKIAGNEEQSKEDNQNKKAMNNNSDNEFLSIFTDELEKSREATDMSNIRAAYAEVTTEYIANGSNKAYCSEVLLKQQEDGWQDAENGKLYGKVDNTEKEIDIADDIVGPSKIVYVNVDSDGTITVTDTALQGAVNISTIYQDEPDKDEDEMDDQEEDTVEEKDEKKGIGSILGSNENEDEDDDDEEGMEAEGDYIHFKESMASYKGTWVPFEDGFKLYLPNTWNEFILSDEQKESGTLYQAGDARAVDGENAPYIAVNFGATQGLETMEEVKEDMEQSGYDIEGIVNVNGIECLSYSYDEPNLSGMMFFYPGRTDYVFAVVAYNYDDFEDILGPVLCSISLT